MSPKNQAGTGTPFQYFCLENPMDGGAWWAAVHGVAKSRTQLSDFISLPTFMHWRRKWQPTPVFLPGESQGQGSLVGSRLWGRTESDTTEATQQQQQQPFILSILSLPGLFFSHILPNVNWSYCLISLYFSLKDFLQYFLQGRLASDKFCFPFFFSCVLNLGMSYYLLHVLRIILLMYNSWFMVFFFQHFKCIISMPSDHHGL